MSLATAPLPLQPTPLVGREIDLARASAMLAQPDVRLLTMTGPPGVGKTRLAVAVAEFVAARFDEVAFVDLAPLSDASLVLDAIAAALGLSQGTGRPVAVRLAGSIVERRLLLLLDNLEHLLDAAPQLADLLAACPGLTLLVTSRTPLDLRWEHRCMVEPLSDAYARALFMERAHIDPGGGGSDPDTVALVDAICARLDGLPLAVELAAARVRALSLKGLAGRLERGGNVLTGGPRDLPERQRTLRHAIAWSYDLLPPTPRLAFRRLAVFPAGCTLEAAAALLADAIADEDAIADALGTLVEANLLQRSGSGSNVRYRMLETVREYADELLVLDGARTTHRRGQASYYADLAERAEPFLKSGSRAVWLARFDQELDNIRAALTWCRQEPDAVGTGLRLAAALEWYWHFRDHWREALDWLESLLARAAPALEAQVRAKALYAAGRFAVFLPTHRPAHARARLEASRNLFQQLGDAWGQAYACSYLARLARIFREHDDEYVHARQALDLAQQAQDRWGTALACYYLATAAENVGRIQEALTVCEQGMALFKELDDGWGYALLTEARMHLAIEMGDLRGARAAAEEALALRRADGEAFAIGSSLAYIGRIACLEGDYATAEAHLAESLALNRAIGHVPGIREQCRWLGHIALERHDIARAAGFFKESLTIARDLGQALECAFAVVGLAGATGRARNQDQARRLVAAVAAYIMPVLASGDVIDQWQLRRGLGYAGDDGELTAHRSGPTINLDEAIAEAIKITFPQTPIPERAAAGPTSTPPPTGLTRREVDVLRLLATGASNKEIAATLVLSHRTVERHIAGIYRKIGARRRGDAIAYAFRHQLEAPLTAGSSRHE